MIKLPYNQQLAEAGAAIHLAATGQPVTELAYLLNKKVTGDTLFFTLQNSTSALGTRPESGVLHHEITGIWLGFSANFLVTRSWFNLDRLLKDVRLNADAYEGWKFVWVTCQELEKAKPHQELW